ncbi:hypothetical protein MFIFM68171_08389 [Madurella fahalii]|uniref:Uncharacterized protein n=1 Tax=Madurella fahalii TaxID=1157608 RepID=A0ABQ0GKG0_9PEZI
MSAVDMPHEDVNQAGETNKTPELPVIVRGKVIHVQSPYLTRALAEDILNGYPGISHSPSELVFREPFQPLLHRWGDLLKFMERDDLDETTKAHTTILHEILEREMHNTIGVFKQHILSRDITFDHAWMIFQPGCIVVSSFKSGLAAYELDRAEYRETQLGKMLRLYCECLDWHGGQYCRKMSNIDLFEFEGTHKIKTLEAFPIELSDDKEQIKSRLEKQGEDFASFVHYQYQAYSGPAFTWDADGYKQEIQVSGRIIIDPKSFDQFSPYCSGRWKRMSARDYDMLMTSRATQNAMRKLRVNVEGSPVIVLSSFHHMICSSMVRGYSTKLKMWLEFSVSHVTETSQVSSPVESVRFSESMEKIISSFARVRPTTERGLWTPDQIEHIAMSIHILGEGSRLEGTTAEAVSDRIGIPLLTINRDDLGTSLLQTESRLREILELVHQWHTLVLLDGIDFLVDGSSSYDFGLDDVLRIIVYDLNNRSYKGPFFISTNQADDVYKALLMVSNSSDE